jgi:general secretion pathway protein F
MRYQARVISDGMLSTLTLDAASEDDARSQARAQGYDVLEASPEQGLFLNARKRRFPLLLFSQELLVLLGAGLGLIEALEGIHEKENRPEAREVLGEVLQSLYQGQTFSSALERYPQAFPALYVAMMRASEKTGDIGEALTRYVAYESQLDILKKKLIAASIYPALLISVGGLVTLFLLGYVVPRFGAIYEDAGDKLPWMSRVLLVWGQLVQQHGELLMLSGVGLLVMLGYGLTHPGTRAYLGAMAWRIPAIGDRMRMFQMARFYRTLGMLLSGGIPILGALEMARGLLASALAPSLSTATELIRAGLPVSEAMEQADLVTPLSLRMLRVGEKSGEMGRMMEHIAALHDEEMSRWLDWFTRLVEPLLMMLIGLVIGAVVMMLYMPIFDLAGSLQ